MVVSMCIGRPVIAQAIPPYTITDITIQKGTESKR